MDFQSIYKVVLIGESGVGKSNLLCQFTKKGFNVDQRSTIGVEFATKSIRHNGEMIKAQIWDTAGQERYRSITKAYYRGSVGAFLIFDLTRKATLAKCQEWLSELRYATAPTIPVMLVGNKYDLKDQREVDVDDALEFASREGLTYIETSALTAHNVDQAFTELIVQTHESQTMARGAEKQLPAGQKVNLKDKNNHGVLSKWCNL